MSTQVIDSSLGTQYAMTVSGGGWVSDHATCIPYQLTDGSWRMKFNASGSSTSATEFTVSITGVVFAAYTNGQAIAVISNSATPFGWYGSAQSGTNGIVLAANNSSNSWSFSGDVALASKPTFVP